MSYSKYSYADTPSWQVRATYAIGILCWLGTVYGYVHFFMLNSWYWVFMGPFLFVASAYYLLSYSINLFYKEFNSKVHRQFASAYWRANKPSKNSPGKLPTVDILLPVCGEGIPILRKVWRAVDNLDYPKDKLKIYVLDDSQDDPDVEKMAAQFGFKYLARPNKSEMKKAGNLKYGYKQSSGEFIAIFDADCAPHKDFLRELLPYTQDKKIAIVQSPQYFSTSKKLHLRSALEFGAGHVQEDFYRIIQRSRDHFGGAICVGTNALYRRSALDKVGGTYQIEHSEDVHTGFSLIQKGYRIKYIPVIVAIGLCPDNQHAYFRQQFRWCSGSMSLLMSGKLLDSSVSFKQKLCYISGFLYYINHVLVLFWPFQLFLQLGWHFANINLINATPFIPYIVYSFLILPNLRLTKPRFGTYLAMVSYSWSYATAVVVNLLGGKLEWKASHGSDNHLWSREYSRLVLFSTGYWCVYVTLIGIFAALHRFPITNYKYYSVIIWAFFNTFLHGIFIYKNLQYMHDRKKHSVLRGGAHYKTLTAWRLKTVGVLGVYLCLLVLGTALARQDPQLTAWINKVRLKTSLDATSTSPARQPGRIQFISK